jgi:hypothetical protein
MGKIQDEMLLQVIEDIKIKAPGISHIDIVGRKYPCEVSDLGSSQIAVIHFECEKNKEEQVKIVFFLADYRASKESKVKAYVGLYVNAHLHPHANMIPSVIGDAFWATRILVLEQMHNCEIVPLVMSTMTGLLFQEAN